MADVITATQDPATETFTVAGAFWLIADDLEEGEFIEVNRPNNAGDGYKPATNKEGHIKLSKYPNLVYCNFPPGTYQAVKSYTQNEVSLTVIEE